MIKLINLDTSSYYFGILTVFEYPEKGYVREGVLSYLRRQDDGYVIEVYGESEGELEVMKKIQEKAQHECGVIGIPLMRY